MRSGRPVELVEGKRWVRCSETNYVMTWCMIQGAREVEVVYSGRENKVGVGWGARVEAVWVGGVEAVWSEREKKVGRAGEEGGVGGGAERVGRRV